MASSRGMWMDARAGVRTFKILVWGPPGATHRIVEVVARLKRVANVDRHEGLVAAVDVTLSERHGVRTDVFLVAAPELVGPRSAALAAADGVLFVAADHDWATQYDDLRSELDRAAIESASFAVVAVTTDELSSHGPAIARGLDVDLVRTVDPVGGSGVLEALAHVVDMASSRAVSRARQRTRPLFSAVVLVGSGERNARMVQLVQTVTGKTHDEALALIETVPSVVVEQCAAAEALLLKQQFEAVGASVELRF